MKENKDDLERKVTQSDINVKPISTKYDLLAQKFRQPPNVQEECVISQVYAVRQPFWLLILEILSYICTGGILIILNMWIAGLRFRLFFLITTMDKAEKVAVFGPDNDVQIVSLVKAKASENSLKQFQLLNQNLKNQRNALNDEEDQLNSKGSSVSPQAKCVFQYRFYKYQYIEGEFVPYGFLVSNFKNSEFLQTYREGLKEEQIIDSYERNGKNNTDVPDQGLLIQIIREIISPFYMFQIGSTTLWFYEGYEIYAYIIIITSTLSTILKIYEERSNFNRLKKFSFFRCQTEVSRNGKKTTINSQEVGFGEKMFIKEGQIAPCDLVVSAGSAIVNEAMLTGESIPIVKTALSGNSDIFQENKQNVIYCGSQIQQVSNDIECLVIRVGFDTLKGNLIRSIMYPKHHNQLSFANDSGKFIALLFFVAFISFIASINTFLDKYDRGEIAQEDIIIRLLDLVTISVPPALPTCLSFGISFSLKRMNKKKVFCINPEKINLCGIVRTICFDKTGTLTEEKLSFRLVSAYDQSTNFVEQKSAAEMGQFQKMIMASCHSLMFFQGKNAGDPLDVEMFESTGSAIVPENVQPLYAEISGNAVISEISLNGNLQDRSKNNTIAILRRFQFESEVERMSAVVFVNGECFVVTKGSPEKLLTICKPESIPKNFNQILKSFTQEGQRVIALSYKQILPTESDGEKERIQFENNLTFAGFLVFENKLKPETNEHIELLQKNGIQIHMVTGDNPLTSLSVAKQCKLLSAQANISVLDVIEENSIIKSTLNGIQTSFDGIVPLLAFGNNQFVMTGNFFKYFLVPLKKKEDPALPYLLSLTKVYARMKPDQKQSLIRLLQTNQNARKTYSFIGMCGDGANDCQALKDADMGISLGEAEASIAASFTSKVVNISIIEFILREGRCCLATSFQCFKFMSLYSIIQCSTTGILYQRGAVPGNYQFLYWDLFIIIPLAFAIGLTDASSNLTKRTPSHRLFSHTNLFSVIGLGLIQFFFLVISLIIASSQDWYYSPNDIIRIGGSDPADSVSNSFDNAILFWVSNFQYIFSVIAFSLGSEHKKPFFTNIPFTGFLIAIIVLSIYAVFSREMSFTDFFDISGIAYDADGNEFSVMPYSWRFVVAAIIVANTITVIIFEKYILKMLISLFERQFPNYVYHGIFTGQLKKGEDVVESINNSGDKLKTNSQEINGIQLNQQSQSVQ